MFGMDGLSSKSVRVCLRPYLQSIARRANALFPGTDTAAIGIGYSSAGITAAVVRMQEGAPSQREGELAGPTDNAMDFFLVENVLTGNFPEGASFDLQLVAERAAQLLANHGLETLPIGIAVPKDQSYPYEIRLPEEVLEWREAVRWEIDEQLQQEGLGIDTSYIASRKSGATVETAVVPRQYAEELLRLFSQAIRAPHCLSVFYPQAPQVTGHTAQLGTDIVSFSEAKDEASCRVLLQTAGPALAAALGALGHGEALGLSVWTNRSDKEGLLFKRFSILVAGLTLCLLFLWGAVDGALLWSAQGQATKAEESVMGLSQDAKDMKRYETLQRRIDKKEALLLKLSEGPIPAYGLLVHLGRPEALVEGVWLTGVHVQEKGELLLQGNAVTMEALSQFMGALEGDTGFFKDTPVLEEADEGQKEKGKGISFRIRTSCR